MAGLDNYVILLLVVMLVIPTLLLVEPTEAQTEQVTTFCVIFVDDIVEGQPVTVTIQMSPATPTGEGYRVWMWVTPPNPEDFSANEPWLKNLLTDSNGKATATFKVLAYSGKWYVDVSFESNSFANHTILYLAGHWQKEFTVNPVKTPTPTITAFPTPASTPTPAVPEFPITASMIAVLVVVSLLLIVGKKKLTVEHIL